jgi:hypothetical protein
MGLGHHNIKSSRYYNGQVDTAMSVLKPDIPVGTSDKESCKVTANIKSSVKALWGT